MNLSLSYNMWLTLVIGLTTTMLIIPFIMKIMKERGITGIDVHKRDLPAVPQMGGIAIIVGLALGILGAVLIQPEKSIFLASFLLTVLIAGVVGIVDDLKTLSARMKPFLLLFAGLPILLMGTYDPYPVFPLIGATRLTIIYPLFIPIAIAVCSNAVNMMDPFNGAMSGTCAIITIALLASAVILGRSDGILLSLCLLGPLLAFFYFNKYPSKVFSGDVGSLTIGAALGAIAILGRLEVIALVAFIPQIMNAFYGLSTIGRLYERREVSRPISILEDGRLAANNDQKAPVTLARVILAKGPLYEFEAVRIFFILSAISGVLAIFTAYLTLVAV